MGRDRHAAVAAIEAVLDGVGHKLGQHRGQRLRRVSVDHSEGALQLGADLARGRGHDRGHAQDGGEDLIEVHMLIDVVAQGVVDGGDSGHPALGLGQGLTGLLVRGAAGLHTQQRRDGLQVVLDPVVDLPDGGVLVEQDLLTPTHLGDVTYQEHRPGTAPLERQRDGAHRQEHSPDLDLGEPGLPAHEDHGQRLIDGGTGGDDRGDGLGQQDPLQLALDAQAVEAGAPVGADVDDPPLLVQAQDAVGHARRAVADRGAGPLDGELARGGHLAQDLGDLLHLPLNDAPAPDNTHRGLPSHDGDRRAGVNNRDVLLLDRGGAGPVGFGGVLDLGGGQ